MPAGVQRSTSSQQSLSRAQPACRVPGQLWPWDPSELLTWRGRHILRQGQPFLPILSPIATGSWQPGGQTPVCSVGQFQCRARDSVLYWQSLLVHPEQDENNTKGNEGRRIFAVKVLRNMASSRAAVNFMPHSCCALLQPFYPGQARRTQEHSRHQCHPKTRPSATSVSLPQASNMALQATLRNSTFLML